jgi:hypothetical protein
MNLVNRLTPFSRAVPGTSLAFREERKRLYSIVGSPIYQGKPWRWFVTFSNADIFEEYIYRMIFNDGNGNIVNESGEILSGEEGESFLRNLIMSCMLQLRLYFTEGFKFVGNCTRIYQLIDARDMDGRWIVKIALEPREKRRFKCDQLANVCRHW